MAHDFPLKPHQWWACDYPERPSEAECTAFESDCPACRIKAAADVARIGDRPLIDEGTGQISTGSLSDLAAGTIVIS